MSLHVSPAHELSLAAEDILRPEKDGICDQRLRFLQTQIHQALTLVPSLRLQLSSQGLAPDIQSQLLRQMAELFCGDKSRIWASVQGDSLIIREEAPRLSWSDIHEKLHAQAAILRRNPDSLLQRKDQCWDEHLKYTGAHLRDAMKQRNVKKLDSDTAERRIRGRSAEFILQMTLEQCATTFTLDEVQTARLINRPARFTFPDVPSGNKYRWHPTTFHNGELKMSESISNTHARQRHQPMQQSNCTLCMAYLLLR